MNFEREAVKVAIRGKVISLAKDLGADANGLTDNDIIPATGFLDSAAMLELVVWYEAHYGLQLRQDEINIDNLGSVNAMTDFLLQRKLTRP